MDLDVYKRRLGATNQSQALVNTTIKQVKSTFKNSPNYKTLLIDGVEKGVRVNTLKDGEKELLLQPRDSTNKGALMVIDGDNWMVSEFKPNEIYPKAKILFCNQVLKWSDSKGRYEYPCIAKSKTISPDSLNQNSYIIVADNDIVVEVPYNGDTSKIKETQRFVLANKSFEVVGIDNITKVYNDSGILSISLQRVSMSDSENETELPDNNDGGSGWGGGW